MNDQPEPRYEVVAGFPVTPGAVGVVVPVRHADEVRSLEENREQRHYRVRGYISDHVPIAGAISEILDRSTHHRLFLNGPELSAYLHRGGWDAFFVDFRAGNSGAVEYLEVTVETELPSDAFRLGRGALNEVLDSLARAHHLPLVLSRLDLVSLDGDYPIAHEIVLPFPGGIRLGPIGGFDQPKWFAPYDALYREALTTRSPYYRLLCTFRLYEGISWLRKKAQAAAADFGVDESLPKDPRVDTEELRELGVQEEFLTGVRTAADLFAKWKRHRNHIAHFLLRDGSHMYISKAESTWEYSLTAAVLFRYASQAAQELRTYYQKHLANFMMRGSVLPELKDRDRFVVRDVPISFEPDPSDDEEEGMEADEDA